MITRRQTGGTVKFPKNTYRKELLRKKHEFLSALGLHSQKLAAVERSSEDDLTAHLQEQSVELGLSRVVHQQLREVEYALDRLASGEYGTCADCGDAISPNRLQAVPWARYCVNCQDRIAA
ncbi:MAG: TraR/DksA family transcriptional regulator [Acidobacteria bacterium]|nr:TraR/DksA family transcriptional regulator [Acidobacteriota bacterium]